MKFISNDIKMLDIQCTLCNIHAKLFYNKHVATLKLATVIKLIVLFVKKH